MKNTGANATAIRDEVWFQRYARLDGTTEEMAVIHQNGDARPAPVINDFGAREAALHSGEHVGFLRDLYGNLTKVQRRTWHMLLNNKTILEISQEEGRSRTAIYKRVESMITRNGFCKRWWRRRDKKNQYE